MKKTSRKIGRPSTGQKRAKAPKRKIVKRVCNGPQNSKNGAVVPKPKRGVNASGSWMDVDGGKECKGGRLFRLLR